MKPITAISVVLLFFGPLFTGALASELKINLQVNGKSMVQINLDITGDLATAKVADQIEQFNLKDPSWLDLKTGKWTTLAECQEWAEQSKTKTLKAIDSAPGDSRAFLMWSLYPTFQTATVKNKLQLTSGLIDYSIEGQATKGGADKYFQYAILNAYKKAMTEGKLPPFAELKAISEMQKLGHIPRSITVAMPGIPNAPKLKMEITEKKR